MIGTEVVVCVFAVCVVVVDVWPTHHQVATLYISTMEGERLHCKGLTSYLLSCSHAIDWLSEVGVKCQKLLALPGETFDLCFTTHEYLIT